MLFDGLDVRAALLAGLLVPPLSCAAQSTVPTSRSGSSSFSIMLTVRPVFRILQMTPVPGGHEYRVWTNMKTAQLNGREYRFERVGEATLLVPGPPIEPYDPAGGNQR